MFFAALSLQVLLIQGLAGSGQLHTVESGHPTQIVKHFEVIKPFQLHERRQRRDISTKTEEGHFPRTKFAFEAKGKHFVLDVTLNSRLFHKDYVEWYQEPSGNFTKIKNPEHCFYHGIIANQPNSTVAISTCDGLSGVIHSEDGNSYGLEPIQRNSSGDTESMNQHMFYNLADLLVRKGYCGVKDSLHLINNEDLLRGHNHLRFRRATSQMKETRYITLMLVNDLRQFERFKKNITEVNLRAKKIANLMDLVYKTINTRVALVAIETWNVIDMIHVQGSATATLDEFHKYDRDVLKLTRKLKHDNAQLLTGINFGGAVVGMAGVGTICGLSSTGVDMDHDSSASAIVSANTVAHEMGHNLGMLHDQNGCACGTGPCVMSASVSSQQVKGFTDCSLNYFENRIKKGLGSCMYDVPEKLWGKPVCGNDFLEEGEECDCGTEAECLASGGSACCNATLCKLHAHAQCAVGPCCSNCSFTPQNTLCRANSTECDLPEYCTGRSAQCPGNFYKKDGSPCKQNMSYCFEGGCQTHDEQCLALWGTGAKKGEPICFENLNIIGDEYGNCGKNTRDQYVGCKPQDVKCGKLQCQGMTSRFPIIGSNKGRRTSTYTIGGTAITCIMGKTSLGADAKDPTIAAQGTKCAEGKLCYNYTCANISKLEFIKQCKPECKNGGICNNMGHCHCLPGWQCPTCELPYDGPGGSIDSGSSCKAVPPVETDKGGLSTLGKAMLILFLGVLPVLAVAGFLGYKYRNSLCKGSSMSPSKTSKPFTSKSPPRAQQYIKEDFKGANGDQPKTAYQNPSYRKEQIGSPNPQFTKKPSPKPARPSPSPKSNIPSPTKVSQWPPQSSSPPSTFHSQKLNASHPARGSAPLPPISSQRSPTQSSNPPSTFNSQKPLPPISSQPSKPQGNPPRLGPAPPKPNTKPRPTPSSKPAPNKLPQWPPPSSNH